MKTPQEIAEMISKRFYPLPDADLDSLASIIESSKAAKGELLLDNGQISKYLYYVESGLLRQFYYKNKRDITEHFSCEGNIVICIASTFCITPEKSKSVFKSLKTAVKFTKKTVQTGLNHLITATIRIE